MLFDSPADPRDYPWRDHLARGACTTNRRWRSSRPTSAKSWSARASRWRPTAGRCSSSRRARSPTSGAIRRFDFADTLEERLLAAACTYSRRAAHRDPLAARPPAPAGGSSPSSIGKKLVHVPLAHFSQETIQQLRMFHVLNGQRSPQLRGALHPQGVTEFALVFLRRHGLHAISSRKVANSVAATRSAVVPGLRRWPSARSQWSNCCKAT